MGQYLTPEVKQEIKNQTAHMSFFERNQARFAIATLLSLGAVGSANAAIPDIDTADIISYIGLLVAAVATVGSAFLMVYLAAKGIKAIRAAF